MIYYLLASYQYDICNDYQYISTMNTYVHSSVYTLWLIMNQLKTLSTYMQIKLGTVKELCHFDQLHSGNETH